MRTRETVIDELFERINRYPRHEYNKYFLKILLPFLHSYTLNVGCGHTEFGDVRVDIRKTSTTTDIADARDLPFEDETFDTTVGLSFLHHIPNYEKAIAEMFRVTKKGGVVAGWEPKSLHPYLISFTYRLGLTAERPLSHFKLRRELQKKGRIKKEIFFFGLKFLTPLLGKRWKVLLKAEKKIPDLFKGFYGYIANKEKVKCR